MLLEVGALIIHQDDDLIETLPPYDVIPGDYA